MASGFSGIAADYDSGSSYQQPQAGIFFGLAGKQFILVMGSTLDFGSCRIWSSGIFFISGFMAGVVCGFIIVVSSAIPGRAGKSII